MKKLLIIIAIALCFAGCEDFLVEPDAPLVDEGLGLVSVQLVGNGENNARTLMPSEVYGLFYYRLTFTPESGGSSVIENIDGKNSATVKLPPGEWTLGVKGFLSKANSSNPTLAVLSGSMDEPFTVANGAGTSLTVEMNHTLAQTGSGKLKYDITLPVGTAGILTVENIDSGGTSPNPISLAGSKSGEITLASGFYSVVVKAEYDGNEKVWREVAQIYDNAVTEAVHVFTSGDITNESAPALIDFDIGNDTGNIGYGARYYFIDKVARKIDLIVFPGNVINYCIPKITFKGTMVQLSGDVILGGHMDGHVIFRYPAANLTCTIYSESGETEVWNLSIRGYDSALKEYLQQCPANTSSNPIKLKISMSSAGDAVIGSAFLVDTINSSGRYVAVEYEMSDPGGLYSSIELGSFRDCAFLTSVNIPEGVTFIPNGAFMNCSSLVSMNIPDSVTKIDWDAFNGCTSLTSINIPDSVTQILSNAFNGCTSLTSVNIPEGVTFIAEGIFMNCSSLVSINIPDSVTRIDRLAFDGCTSLTSINILEGILVIYDSAFRNCTSLRSVTIPASVINFSDRVFDGCSGLTSVVIQPGKFSYIGIRTFYNCSSLTSITIPANVIRISDQAFGGCSSLNRVTINANITNPSSIYDRAFHGDLKTKYLAGGPGTYTTISPDNLNAVWRKQ